MGGFSLLNLAPLGKENICLDVEVLKGASEARWTDIDWELIINISQLNLISELLFLHKGHIL